MLDRIREICPASLAPLATDYDTPGNGGMDAGWCKGIRCMAACLNLIGLCIAACIKQCTALQLHNVPPGGDEQQHDVCTRLGAEILLGEGHTASQQYNWTCNWRECSCLGRYSVISPSVLGYFQPCRNAPASRIQLLKLLNLLNCHLQANWRLCQRLRALPDPCLFIVHPAPNWPCASLPRHLLLHTGTLHPFQGQSSHNGSDHEAVHRKHARCSSTRCWPPCNGVQGHQVRR